MTAAPSARRAHQRTHGRFFTTGNPFGLEPFQRWYAPLADRPVVEPFCGNNGLVRLMREAGHEPSWSCYDLHPPASSAEGQPIQARDAWACFPPMPAGGVIVTNPPYLSRSSASRHGLDYPKTPYDDLYKSALSIMLEHAGFVAALVPDSFVVSGLFHRRLQAVVVLTDKMFDDTDHPVCLALFVPAAHKPVPEGFDVWEGGVFLGQHQDLRRRWEGAGRADEPRIPWRFNDANGSLGLHGVDGTRGASLRFVPGTSIPSSSITSSSRLITRISGLPESVAVDGFVAKANQALDRYRTLTHDVLLASFKGVRADGRYRRRLDYATARHLLDRAWSEHRLSAQGA